jgi:membrane-associated protease RseP (regulator of RpoE activity)
MNRGQQWSGQNQQWSDDDYFGQSGRQGSSTRRMGSYDDDRGQWNDYGGQESGWSSRGYYSQRDQRPMLGVTLDRYSRGRGVTVNQVERNTPAEEAGFEEGDTILAIDGQGVQSPQDVQRIIAQYEPQASVQIEIERDGERQQLEATLASSQAQSRQSQGQRSQQQSWSSDQQNRQGQSGRTQWSGDQEDYDRRGQRQSRSDEDNSGEQSEGFFGRLFGGGSDRDNDAQDGRAGNYNVPRTEQD